MVCCIGVALLALPPRRSHRPPRTQLSRSHIRAAAGGGRGRCHLLELECEAFISLCGEPKTQERMQYMVMNNKPLRN